MKGFLPTIALVLLLPLAAGAQEYILHKETLKTGPTSLNFSPDGSLLLAGFSDGSFRVVDPESFEPSLEVPAAHTKAVTAMDMPPKMDFILSAGGNVMKLWDRKGKHIGNLNGHATTIWDAEISRDGKHAVSTAFNKTFLLWDVYNGVIAQKMQGHEDVTLAACISKDNRWIASGSHDLSVKVWDLETRSVAHTLHGPTQEVLDVEFSPDGSLLAVASKENTVRIYQVEKASLKHILKGHREAVRRVAFSPDGRYLVSASEDQNIILWDVVKGERVHTFVENEGMLLDVEYHPSGGSIYTASTGGELIRRNLDPELFVLRYYPDEYRKELEEDPLFAPRQKAESRKEFQDRQARAASLRSEIVSRYYSRYLEERDAL
jgi:WD40 repeat protein